MKFWQFKRSSTPEIGGARSWITFKFSTFNNFSNNVFKTVYSIE